MSDLNHVTISGNLTRDPELRHTPSGVAVASLRVACNGSKKSQSGQWEDVPNYFDVVVWKGTAEFVAQRAGKGDPIFLTGRLQWSEWDAQDGTKRQKVEVVADNVRLPKAFSNGASASGPSTPSHADDFVPAAADDDIPF